MKKWWIAFAVEMILGIALFVGFFVYQNYYNGQLALLEKQQEQERKREEKIQQELQAKVEEENRVQRVKDDIAEASEVIEGDFANWLYENYWEVTEVLAEAVANNTYEDKLWYEKTGKSIFVLRDEYSGLLKDETTMSANGIYQRASANTEYISLSFAGDVSFANDYTPAQNYTRLGINGAFSEEIQATMKEADIFMLNNEFCYTTSNTRLGGKTYAFRAAPELVSRLDEMGVDIVSIANNHAYDYGEQGFIDTMNTLKKANIPYVGGGVNLADAKKNIVYFVINGMKIGYIAATQVERNVPIFTQPATENGAGVIRCFESELVCEMVAEAKKNCDFVIVYPHWRTELKKEAQADQQALAYAFIEAGADVVVGGHPHCLQGVEYYKGVPIFYSLSNFSFSSKTVDSCILNLEVTIDGIRNAKYIPCRESGGMTYQCDKGAGEYNQIIQILNTYSVNAHLDEGGNVSQTQP